MLCYAGILNLRIVTFFGLKKRKQKSYRYRYLRKGQWSNLQQHLKLYKSV